MEKNKVQNDKVQPDDEISDKDLDKVAGGNKYADDFKQINTKLDALATTRAQVTALQTSIK